VRFEVGSQQLGGAFEERLLAPVPTFQALDDDPAAFEIEILTLEERDLPHPKAVEIDQRKKRAIARFLEDVKERAQLKLCFDPYFVRHPVSATVC
jgi:hypothetical protein